MTCPHRTGDICAKIKGHDRTVTDADCATCPFTAIGCAHLRISLDKTDSGVALHRATCAERVMVVRGVETCAGCQQRVPIYVEDLAPVEREGRGKLLAFPRQRVRTARPIPSVSPLHETILGVPVALLQRGASQEEW